MIHLPCVVFLAMSKEEGVRICETIDGVEHCQTLSNGANGKHGSHVSISNTIISATLEMLLNRKP